jgi:hypothetical protein
MKHIASKKATQRMVRLETARFLVRNATVEDTSVRWGSWMAMQT